MKLVSLKKILFFLYLLIFSLCTLAQETKTLETFLDIDRFHAYLQRWSLTMEGRDKKELANAVKSLTPEQIAVLKIDPKKLSDPANYDDLIFTYVKEKGLPVKRADVAWDYNFYKRKLAEAYRVGEANVKPTAAPVVEVGVEGEKIKAPALLAEEQLLNVDGYVSGRTTRGIFWEASVSNRPIELHVGSAGDFRTSLAERGAKVVSQIKTVERNYNPIYLIQVPGEKEYRYANNVNHLDTSVPLEGDGFFIGFFLATSSSSSSSSSSRITRDRLLGLTAMPPLLAL